MNIGSLPNLPTHTKGERWRSVTVEGTWHANDDLREREEAVTLRLNAPHPLDIDAGAIVYSIDISSHSGRWLNAPTRKKRTATVSDLPGRPLW